MFGSKRSKAKARADRDGSSLGHVLLELGYCDTTSLYEALAEQSEDTPRLGRVLVDRGIITEEQLEHALTRQRVLRGQVDPSELVQFGAAKRREALREMTDRLRDAADSATLLAAKMRG